MPSNKKTQPTEFEKFNPIDGSHIGTFKITPKEEVEAAVERARKAFKMWSQTTLRDRFRFLRHLKELCISDVEHIAEQISLDTGKPKFESVALEVLGVAAAIDYYESIAPNVLGRQRRRTPIIFPGKASYVEYFPMGVVGIISPWNFPFQLTMLPIISALISGNTVILKPSELTPMTAEVARELFTRARLPEGVVQILQGDGSTGAALASSSIDKIFFTGSVATGKKIAVQAAERLIPVELELGGKDPFIVCKDANIHRAAGAAVWGSLVNCGQVCTSVERIFCHEAVYEEFLAEVKSRMLELTLGTPDSGCDIGPMVSPSQIEIVERQLKDAVEKGAVVEIGGKRLDKPGNWFEPTLLTGVTTEMSIYQEETFGPVVAIMKVSSTEEAVRLANDHKFGLTGSVWTSDYCKGISLASYLVCGQASVNDVIQSVGNMVLPFGGVKESGIGRYHGPEGLLSFVHTKAIQADRGWLGKEISWFPYKDKYEPMVTAMKGLTGGNLPKALLPLLSLFRKTK